MKRKFIILVCAAMCLLSSCGGENGGTLPKSSPTPTPVYALNPSDVLTADNLSLLVTYPLICNIVSDTPTHKILMCMSDPVGNDPIEIDVQQYSNDLPKSNIKSKYDSDRAMRSSAEDIALDGGFEGYIAYPYVKIYYDGYYITITAGSGNDDEQKQLLMQIASVAVNNLKALLPSETNETPAASGE